MAEPRIQYAKTSDGVSIAYAVLGEGPPVVFAPGLAGAVHLYSSGSVTTTTDTFVALGWRIIIYDGRGTGSSDRGNADFSLDARLRDLEAVIERTGVDRFALGGSQHGGPAAIAYAVNRQDRVSRLVLSGTYAKGADYYQSMPAMRMTQGAKAMTEEDWEFFTNAAQNALTGFRDSEAANRWAAVWRAGMSATAYASLREASEKIDVTELLPLVNVPTLVVDDRSPLSNVLHVLASRIPNAHLVSTDDWVRAVDAFLREGEEAATIKPESAAAEPTALRTVLFTDLVGHTEMMSRLGDERGRDVLGSTSASRARC